MSEKTVPPHWMHDIASALGLLTRIPVAVDTDRAIARSAAAAWAYPVVGFFLGGLCLLVAVVLQMIQLPMMVVLVLVIGFQIIITGAMHEDGLADSADALWGGWSAARRLEIMKDSSIGVYGVCALGVILLLKLSVYLQFALMPVFALALCGAAGLSRAAMVVLMRTLPNARGGGLSQNVGRPSAQTAWIAVAIAVAGTLCCGAIIGEMWGAILMIIATTFAAWGCRVIAKRKIKGQTGDILGATQQICEIAALMALSTVAAQSAY